jgi:hypothetical protein
MAIQDHLQTYSVANIGGIGYREHTALVTSFYMLWLERLPSAQRELMDIALAELVAHGSVVAPDYAKPIKSAQRRTEGQPIMYELKHPKHPAFAIRAFGIRIPDAPLSVLMISGGNKHNLDSDQFYNDRVPVLDRFIDTLIMEGN